MKKLFTILALLPLALFAQPKAGGDYVALTVHKDTGAIRGPVSASTFATANSLSGGGGGSGIWGSITGTLSNQTDLQTALSLRALIASPAFTGIPTAPTAAVDTNTTQIATTQFVIGQSYLKTTTAASTYQPIDSDLTSIAALSTTSFGRGILAETNAASMRSTLNVSASPTGTPDGTKFLRDDNTWQAIPGGGDALTSSPLSQFAATTSAQLASVLSDEAGSSGGFVRSGYLGTAATEAASSFQAADADLTTFANITPAANVVSILSAADYSAIRTLLSLVPGTNVQAYDSDLSLYAGITPSASVQSLLGAADYSAMRTQLSLVPGTNVQAFDADLSTWAGITPSANVQSLAAAANYAAIRGLLDLEAGTDFLAYPTGTPDGTKFLRDDNTWQEIPGGGDLLSTNNLADVANAATARDNLGVEIGVDVQAFDSDLSTYAGITPSANAQSLLGAADYSAMRTQLSLVPGTNVQAFDADLSALAGLTSAADKLPYFTGSGTAAVADFSSFGRSLVDDASATAARVTLGFDNTDLHGSAGIGTTETIDATVGWHFLTLDDDVTLTIDNWPSTGTARTILLEIVQDGTGGHTITWPAGVGTDPTVTTTANAVTLVSLSTRDGGTTIYPMSTAESGGGGLASTDIDTSAELRAIVGDESGTGALIFAGGNIGAATATTATEGDNDTSVATTAFVTTAVAGAGGGSFTTGMTMFIPDADSVPSGWSLTGVNGIPAFTTPDADFKAITKVAGTVATPTADVSPGAIVAGTEVTFSTATSGADMRYTTSGTDPTRSSGTVVAGPVTVTETTTYEVIAYKDYSIDSAVASFAYTIDAVPTHSGAWTIGTDGVTHTLVFSENVTVGAGGGGGFVANMSGGDVTLTYSSGTGTSSLVFTGSRTVIDTETQTGDNGEYTQPGNGIEDSAGQDVATFTGHTITNNSEETGGGGASFSDDFDRSNESPLAGPNWDSSVGNWSVTDLVGNGATSTGSGSTVRSLAMVETSAATFAANQSATITVQTGSLDNNSPAVRIQGGSNGGCYYLQAFGSSAGVGIFKVTDNGGGWSEAQIGSTLAMTDLVNGDTLTLEVTGTTTTTLTVKKNGVTVGSRDDSSSPYTSGQPGLSAFLSNVIAAFSATDL